MSDIFEVLKELDISNVEVSGFKDKHFMRINLDMEDLEKLNVHYYQHLLNLIYQSKIKNRILEKALDNACLYLENIDYRSYYFEREYYQAIGQEGDEEKKDWNDKEEWKEILLKDEQIPGAIRSDV